MESLSHGEKGVNRPTTLPPACLTNGFDFAVCRGECQPVCKPGSVRAGFPAVDDHSSGTPVAGRFSQPTRATGPETALTAFRPPRHPYSVLLPVGFALPPSLLRARCALAAPFHPCARPKPGPRSVFCGTFPGVAPAGRYPAPCFHGARTFLPRTLSGIAAAVIRPAGQLEVGDHTAKGNDRVGARLATGKPACHRK